MVDVYLETITYSSSTAKLIGKTVYLKGTNRMGWKLYDEPPDKPYFIIQADGQTAEIRKEDSNEE
jgi:hypothetical protein